MQLPVQITLRGVDRSDALESSIFDKAAKLEHVCERVLSCRVAVEMERHEARREFVVHVVFKLPGERLLANEERDGDVFRALQAAFDRGLHDLKEVRSPLRNAGPPPRPHRAA